jgi:hypothetical protein
VGVRASFLSGRHARVEDMRIFSSDDTRGVLVRLLLRRFRYAVDML